MDKKLVGLICGIISMVAVLVFFIWGQFFGGYSVSWVVFVVSGIACAIISMIGNYTREKKEDEEGKKTEE